ncbi:alpha/beta fold hydrolase [Phenylobacterium montanum]|uniref:Alpha/beta hydrolase n=1 Tax=Phenylobacterium montanum TaxID=2823693 RepID=A0A975FXB3_9CAUL|nr:alpha/beta hydrolase [Caulobacter sp. S6]QUD86679.1 alpha/beta hydrolase [Caulobacter sp. S6]
MDDLDAEAEALLAEAAKPVRRVRPRLARQLADGEDLEVQTSHGPVMAWRLGVGPATLLVHGWEDDNALWSPLIDECAKIGRAVVALDLPGHGYSQSEANSIEAAAEAVIAVARALGPIDTLVAHSFGCPTSITALSEGLSVERAVMIASPVPRSRDRNWFDARWKRRQRERGWDEAVIERAAELGLLRTAERMASHDRVETLIPQMTARLLAVHAFDDEQCPPEASRIMADRWPGGEIALFDGLGHRLIAQDDAVLERVMAFLEDFG